MNISDRLSDDLRFSDANIGMLCRKRVFTWRDLTKISFDEIKGYPGANANLYEIISDGLRSRGCEPRAFSAYRLISDKIRNKLSNAGIDSLKSLSLITEDELGVILRSRSHRYECKDILRLCSLSLKPVVSEGSERLQMIRSALDGAKVGDSLLETLNLSPQSIKAYVTRIEKLKRQQESDFVRRDRWQEALDSFEEI